MTTKNGAYQARAAVLATGLLLITGSALSGPAMLELEEAGSWTDPSAYLRDMGGWGDVVVIRDQAPGEDLSNTIMLDLSDPANPSVFRYAGDGDGRGQFGCDDFWEEDIEVRNGRWQTTQAEFCVYDLGKQKGFSLFQDSFCLPLPNQDPGVQGGVSYSDGDFAGRARGGIGDGFVATWRENDSGINLDGVDARLGQSGFIPEPAGFIEDFRVGASRVYISVRNFGEPDTVYSYDASDLANPVEASVYSSLYLSIQGDLGFRSTATEIEIYDPLPASGPALLGAVASPGTVSRFYTFGDRLFVIANGDLFIYDLSTPSAPALIGSHADEAGSINRLGFGEGQIHALVETDRIVTLRIVGETSCNSADIAEPFGVLDLADVQAFVQAFVGMDPIADFAEPQGVFDLADLFAFVGAFTGGCP